MDERDVTDRPASGTGDVVLECPKDGEPLIWYSGIEGVPAHLWCAECLTMYDEDLNEIGELR